ncbi:MAG: hypothetical protein R3C19_23870 [Planctomycetaceae bacterium]
MDISRKLASCPMFTVVAVALMLHESANAQSSSRIGVPQRNAVVAQPQVFDWTAQRTSAADVLLPDAVEFRHGEPGLTPMESEVYRRLVEATEQQYQQLWKQPDINPAEAWETAFYRFGSVRRMAFQNGNLSLTAPLTNVPPVKNLANPFRDADEPATPLQPAIAAPTTPAASDHYSLIADMTRFPKDFVGRPVALYGLFEPTESVELRTGYLEADNPLLRPVRLLRGTLKSLDGKQSLAVVDAKSITTPQSARRGLESWPAGLQSLPVLVKGWVVKQWDTRPLIYCESLRQISAEPYADLIRQYTVPQRRILPEETWLYYETLQQMTLAGAAEQQRLADETLMKRIDALIAEVRDKAAADAAALKLAASNDVEKQAGLAAGLTRIQRLLNARITRYRRCRTDPDAFQTYVDLFQHSDAWQGKLVTLRGHVRHVVSFVGDEMLFGGRPLHEVWLFTDDSQHNPAVIVTPDLPPDFPVGADVIDRVSVTGCYFKRYVYGSQESKRVAPLLLAGRIQWTPTLDQLHQLVDSGDLATGTPLAQRALQQRTESFSQPAMLIVCVLAAMTVMISLGRAHREERDRRRLMRRINADPALEPQESVELDVY